MPSDPRNQVSRGGVRPGPCWSPMSSSSKKKRGGGWPRWCGRRRACCGRAGAPATASSTGRCTRSRSPAPNATQRPRSTLLAKRPTARPRRARCAASSATSRAASTACSQSRHCPHNELSQASRSQPDRTGGRGGPGTRRGGLDGTFIAVSDLVSLLEPAITAEYRFALLHAAAPGHKRAAHTGPPRS